MQQGSIGKWTPGARKCRLQKDSLVIAFSDSENDFLAWRADTEIVTGIHSDKGRHMELFIAGLPDRLGPSSVNSDQVGMSLAKGIVDFVKDGRQLFIGPVAEVDAEWVEYVAKEAGIAQKPNWTVLGIYAGIG